MSTSGTIIPMRKGMLYGVGALLLLSAIAIGIRLKNSPVPDKQWRELMTRRETEVRMRIAPDIAFSLSQRVSGGSARPYFLVRRFAYGHQVELETTGNIFNDPPTESIGSFEISCFYTDQSVDPSSVRIDAELNLKQLDSCYRGKEAMSPFSEHFYDDFSNPNTKSTLIFGCDATLGKISKGKRKLTLTLAWPITGIPLSPMKNRGYADTFYKKDLSKVTSFLQYQVLKPGYTINVQAPVYNLYEDYGDSGLGGASGVVLFLNKRIASIELSMSSDMDGSHRKMHVYIKDSPQLRNILRDEFIAFAGECSKQRNQGGDYANTLQVDYDETWDNAIISYPIDMNLKGTIRQEQPIR